MTDEETAQSHHQLGILEQEMKSAGTSNTAAFSAEAVAVVVAVAVELGHGRTPLDGTWPGGCLLRGQPSQATAMSSASQI
jgi:hypothetical protein